MAGGVRRGSVQPCTFPQVSQSSRWARSAQSHEITPESAIEMGLFAFLRPDRTRLDTLERRLATLEAEEAARTVAFLDIADRVKRHLGRVAAIEGKRQQREEAEERTDPVTLALLRSKYPQQSGG